ncbi:hypothetical protein RQP46_005511 [Phenoliferia psychrophenolica]
MFALGRLPFGLIEPHLLQRTALQHHSRAAIARRPFSSTRLASSVRVRFAPSPTGHLHLGGLRTALFNHLLARKLGGSWTLRIEDTDQARYVEGAVESLIKTLEWAKLDFDDGPGKDAGRGPYFQSKRKHIYDKYLQKLIDKSGSLSMYDRKCLSVSPEEALERTGRGESSIVRFKSSTDGLVQNDLVYDPIKYDSLPIEDFVLRKSDGLPTYHFANVVDDHEMGISHVLRGEEWLPSTPKHLALYAALELTPPQFAHMPILVNPDGTKLSKRAGDVRVEDYMSRGYEPEALLNFVALMGWSPAGAADGASEVMNMQALIDAFSIEGINKNRATMSPSKLDFLNRAHIQLKVELGNDERIHTIKDVPTLGAYFFSSPDLTTTAANQLLKSVKPDVYQRSIQASITALEGLPDASFEEHDTHTIADALHALVSAEGKGRVQELMNPLRHALTGQKVGAAVATTIGTLGREKTLERLNAVLEGSK